MRIEIEIPDETGRATITKAAAMVIGRDPWDSEKVTGSMAEYLRGEIERQIKAHIDAVDLSTEIATVVEAQMMPTIREVIERELKSAARKAVKAEMEKPS